MVIVLASTEPISCDECGRAAHFYFAINAPSSGFVSQLCLDDMLTFVHAWQERGLETATKHLKRKRRVQPS